MNGSVRTIKNGQVLRPYLTGGDLNSSPDYTASRWIIDFTGLSEIKASEFSLPYEHALRFVKPQRAVAPETVRKPLPQRWWHYRKRRALRTALAQA